MWLAHYSSEVKTRSHLMNFDPIATSSSNRSLGKVWLFGYGMTLCLAVVFWLVELWWDHTLRVMNYIFLGVVITPRWIWKDSGNTAIDCDWLRCSNNLATLNTDICGLSVSRPSFLTTSVLIGIGAILLLASAAHLLRRTSAYSGLVRT